MQIDRKILIDIIFPVIGIIIVGAGVFYFLLKNPSILENLKGGRRVPPGTLLIDVSQANKDLSLQKYRVLLPKSKVSLAYYDVFNNVFNEVITIDGAYRNDLSPLLAQAKTDLEKNDYEALAKLGTRASGVNEEQKVRLVILTGYLNNLAAANNTITDEETKKLTADFVAAGKNLVAADSAYSALIDKIIAGNSSSETLAEANAVRDNVASSLASFRDASKKLGSFFTQTLLNDLKAAEATKATTTKKK